MQKEISYRHSRMNRCAFSYIIFCSIYVRSYFLVAEQESNQRSQHRGGADHEAYRNIFLILHVSPASSRPPLCTPSGTCRKYGCGRKNLNINTQHRIHCWKSSITPIRSSLSTGAGWGPGGGRLKVGEEMLVQGSSNERLCGQRIPQPLSLVHFLCGHKK